MELNQQIIFVNHDNIPFRFISYMIFLSQEFIQYIFKIVQ